jgi:DNA-binding XRE family transcriptional regulator
LIDCGTVKKRQPEKSSSRPTETERLLFAAKVRASRAVLGWSQTELGRRTGITQRAVHFIEKGLTQPRNLTKQQIEASFAEVDLVFKPTPDGGFTMTVPSAAVGRSRLSAASRKRLERRRKVK